MSSLTLNMVGGGGGLAATDALLRVQAPAQSTVTITKGSVTKTDAGHENADDNSVYDYYFIIHQSQFDSVNPWTVTATFGSNTKSTTIIINAADEYDLLLSYNVPSAYQEVEYLESTGTQAINTGYTIQNNDKIETIGQLTTSISGDGMYFEVTSGAGWREFLEQLNGYQMRYVYSYNGGSLNYVNMPAQTPNTDLHFRIGTELILNSYNYGSCAVYSTNRPVYLFAGNDIGTLKRFTSVRIKYFKISDSNDVVKREFYPCYRKSDNVAGMWDTVSQSFFTNIGSGTFVVGNNV